MTRHRVTAFFGLIFVALIVACGGIPIGPSPTASGAPPDASSTPAVATTGRAAEAPADATPRSSRLGLAVVAAGKIDYQGDPGARTFREGSELVRATKALAKQLYAVPRLRPHTDETTVATLAGAELDPNAPAVTSELHELRAGLSPDLGATTRALLESLARRVDVEGIVVVTYSTEKGALARLFHIDPAPAGGFSTRLDGAMFSATEHPSMVAGEASSYQWDATSMAALLGPAPSRSMTAGSDKTASAATPGSQPPLAPVRKDAAQPPHPKGTPGKPDEKKSKTIFQSPWFWVAAGAVAAIGVTALVVSQTVNTNSGTVHVQGKVLP